MKKIVATIIWLIFINASAMDLNQGLAKFAKEEQAKIVDLSSWTKCVATLKDSDQSDLIDHLIKRESLYLEIIKSTKQADDKFVNKLKIVRKGLEELRQTVDQTDLVDCIKKDEFASWVAVSQFLKLSKDDEWRAGVQDIINDKRNIILQERKLNKEQFENLKEEEITKISNQAILDSKKELVDISKQQYLETNKFFIEAWSASSENAIDKISSAGDIQNISALMLAMMMSGRW